MERKKEQDFKFSFWASMAGGLPFHIVVRESMVQNCKKRNRGRIDKVTGRRTKEKRE